MLRWSLQQPRPLGAEIKSTPPPVRCAGCVVWLRNLGDTNNLGCEGCLLLQHNLNHPAQCLIPSLPFLLSSRQARPSLLISYQFLCTGSHHRLFFLSSYSSPSPSHTPSTSLPYWNQQTKTHHYLLSTFWILGDFHVTISLNSYKTPQK